MYVLQYYWDHAGRDDLSGLYSVLDEAIAAYEETKTSKRECREQGPNKGEHIIREWHRRDHACGVILRDLMRD